MKIIKLFTDVVTVSAFYIYSSSAIAEEFEESSTFSYLPFLLLLAVVFIFRKKLIAEATPHPHCDDEHHVAEQPEKAAPVEVKAAKQQLIDMSKNVEQCQGSTVKGSRCSRTSNLETIEVTVEGKLYRFKSCKQHNNDSFKPFLS